MKKLLVLLLVPLFFLTACGGGKNPVETRTLTCTLTEGEESSKVEWTAKKITVTTVIAFDDEAIAQSNLDAFRTNKNVKDVSIDGNKVTTVTVTENNLQTPYEDAKAAYEEQGYKCR